MAEDLRPANIVAAVEGFYQFKQVDDLTKPKPYPVIHPKPSFGLVAANVGLMDYVAWGAMIGAALPVGLAIGAPMRIITSKICAVIGFFGGGFYAFQNSYGRLQGFKPNTAQQNKYVFRPTAMVKFPIRQDPIPEDVLKLARE